jgi:hypothetical protein
MNINDSESDREGMVQDDALQQFCKEAAQLMTSNLNDEAKDIPLGYHAKFKLKDANPEIDQDNLILDSDHTLIDDTFIYIQNDYSRITNKETYEYNVRRINDP